MKDSDLFNSSSQTQENNIAKILEERCLSFKKSYIKLSRELFSKNNGSSLMHAGEFGRYREKLVSILLKQFCPTFINISDGFITNRQGGLTTQVDIVGYDQDLVVVKNDLNQPFYMCEAVYLIGEVKSVIKKSDIRRILIKLAKQRDVVFKGRKVTEHPSNRPLTFIVCEKLDFNDPLGELKLIYDKSPLSQHNLILSLEDGLFTYYLDFDQGDQTFQYPIAPEGREPNLIQIYDEESVQHIRLFVGYISQHLSTCDRSKLDLVSYLPIPSTEKRTKIKR